MLGLGAIVAATVIATSSYYAAKYAGNANPNAKKIQADLALMKQETTEWLNSLIPWASEERDLLSFNQINKELKVSKLVTAKGIFTSIYDEAMLFYSYKRYIGKKENALLYARSSNREYIYRIKQEGITIYMNGQLIGLYENDQLMTPQNRLLAKIARNQQKEFFPVMVEGREVGSIVNPIEPSNINKRALDLIDSNITAREESIFLAIAIIEMLRISLKEQS